MNKNRPFFIIVFIIMSSIALAFFNQEENLSGSEWEFSYHYSEYFDSKFGCEFLEFFPCERCCAQGYWHQDISGRFKIGEIENGSATLSFYNLSGKAGFTDLAQSFIGGSRRLSTSSYEYSGEITNFDATGYYILSKNSSQYGVVTFFGYDDLTEGSQGPYFFIDMDPDIKGTNVKTYSVTYQSRDSDDEETSSSVEIYPVIRDKYITKGIHSLIAVKAKPKAAIMGTEPLTLVRETEYLTSPMATFKAIIGQGARLIKSSSGGKGYEIIQIRCLSGCNPQNEPSPQYSWSILQGSDKIRISNEENLRETINVKPIAPSLAKGDIVLSVDVTTQEGIANATTNLTVYKPSSVLQLWKLKRTFNGPDNYGYDSTVRYLILDQFGGCFPKGFSNLTEKLDILYNPYNTEFVPREYLSDKNAEYEDHYILLFHNQKVPDDYLARVRQKVEADGFQILDHIIVWRSSDVTFE